jgi:sec-independent protein translocase protein TatB
VGLIALLVFGPERLPKVAREAAFWIKKLRGMASSVKQEIDREMQLQDLKEAMDKQKREMERMLMADKITGKTAEQPKEGEHE